MERTQIYLTPDERKALKAIAQRLGRPQSEIIRAAVDHYVAEHLGKGRLELLRQARGLWQDRYDLPDLEALRREFDRLAE